MLKSLTVSNFKAFSRPVTIDFSATGNYSFNTEAVQDGIVKTAIMYGKNASGKSSLGFAIFDIVATLTDNFINPANYANYKNMTVNDADTGFEYQFLFGGTQVVYSYRKTDIRTITAEKLVIGNRTLLEYDKSKNKNAAQIDFAGTESMKLSLAELKFSALKYIKANAILADTAENKVFNRFYDFVNKMLLFWSLETREFIGYTPVPRVNIVSEIIKRGHFAELQEFFKEAGFEDELDHRLINGTEQLLIKFNAKNKLEFASACSSGMSSLLLLYFWLEDIVDPKKSPSFVCIDEFDAFYHFELARFIVKKLQQSACQTVLTTHNTSLFTNDLLRPDCYYICSKNRIVNAHNATEKEIREGNNLEKLYRGGTFGL